jgi:hypothetical protein
MGGINSHNPDFSQVEAGNHEAVMYTGGNPELFSLKSFIPLLKTGRNIIAIQGHNTSSSSSDFSLIPALTVGSTDYTVSDIEPFVSTANQYLHTHFKISKEGENLYFYNPAGQLIEETIPVALPDNVSHGRFRDGESPWFYFETPTPGSENKNPFVTIERDTIYMSRKGGYYQSSFQLTLTTPSTGGTIRYTTNGSDPTTTSMAYTSPISINKDMVIKAAYFRPSTVTNPITAATFYFKSPNGLPVVALSTDPKNFFDWNEGIYELGPGASNEYPYFGANFWMDWEKPVCFEYYDKEGTNRINQGAGVKISGNWTRAFAQKSLSLHARNQYGKGSFGYPFFHDRAIEKFETITLRNSGNDWQYTMMRDGVVSEIAREMNIDRLAYQPSVVYLNGEYWGIQNIRERANEHYLAGNYGVDTKEVNILENNGDVIQGKNDDYNFLRSLITDTNLDDEAYNNIRSLMDVECFIDYQILETFIDNRDWPGNNIKFWKTNSPTTKWRWILFDTDFGFYLYNNYDNNPFYFATEMNNSGWPNPEWSTLFLRRLLENQTFRNQFINTYSNHLNTLLSPSKVVSTIDSVRAILLPEIENHQQRWGRSIDSWTYEVNRMRSFASGRNNEIRRYLKEYFNLANEVTLTLSLSDNNAGKIQLNGLIPDEYPFKGNYYREIPITISALPMPGYRFVKWENGSTSSERQITLNPQHNMKLVAVFEPTNEREQKVAINEINYKSSATLDAGDWIELVNFGEQSVDLSGWVLHDNNYANRFIFREGTLLYPGNYLLITENSTKFGALFPNVRNKTGDFAFGLSSNGESVYLYDAEGMLVDWVNYGVSSPWPSTPNGTGETLELIKPEYDNNNATSWAASGIQGGTPGSANRSWLLDAPLLTVNAKPICFPSPFTDYTTMQFYAEKKGSYRIHIYDMKGKLRYKMEGHAEDPGNQYIQLFNTQNQYESGIYFINLQTSGSSNTIKVLKR